MKRFVWIWSLLLVLGASPAYAEHRPVVVELFTAQGCPACPPADKVLVDLSHNENVLALSWSVDYWDYSGWKDTYGSPAHTERQEDYNERMGFNSVYTPQMIINGRYQTVGSRPEEVNELILQSAGDLTLPVSIERSGANLIINVAAGETVTGAEVTFIWFDSFRSVDVMYGDNRGRTLRYANVVRGHRTLGQWMGPELRTVVDLSAVEATGSNGVAVLVQDGPGGAILGAASLKLADQPTVH